MTLLRVFLTPYKIYKTNYKGESSWNSSFCLVWITSLVAQLEWVINQHRWIESNQLRNAITTTGVIMIWGPLHSHCFGVGFWSVSFLKNPTDSLQYQLADFLSEQSSLSRQSTGAHQFKKNVCTTLSAHRIRWKLGSVWTPPTFLSSATVALTRTWWPITLNDPVSPQESNLSDLKVSLTYCHF